MPTSSSSAIARCARLALRPVGRCVRIVSMSWRPIVYSGLSEVSGSWNTAPISRPRTARIASYGRSSMRRPARRISPARDASRRVDQADDRGAGERFAGARFADHAQHLARARSRSSRRARRRACRAASGTRRAGARRRAAACVIGLHPRNARSARERRWQPASGRRERSSRRAAGSRRSARRSRRTGVQSCVHQRSSNCALM